MEANSNGGGTIFEHPFLGSGAGDLLQDEDGIRNFKRVAQVDRAGGSSAGEDPQDNDGIFYVHEGVVVHIAFGEGCLNV